MDTREAARTWLIENNHHGCHLLVDPQGGQREDGEMPREDDIASLALLLEQAGCHGCHMVSGKCPHCGNECGPP